MWREDPPNGSARLMGADTKGGRGGTPHSAARASRVQPGEEGGHPDQAARSPRMQSGHGRGGETPHTAVHTYLVINRRWASNY